MRTARLLKHRAAKPVAFLLCLLPLALLAARFPDGLGFNPAETVNRYTGDWALRFLLLTLVVTPAARLSGWNELMRFRRMIGLFAFFYALAHLTSYVALDQYFDWPRIWDDILKRNFITVGMLTVLLLLPLAVTSTNGMIRRLGGKRWQALHRLVYPAAMLGVLHYYMMVKADTREPLIYAGILAVLLGWRLVRRRRQAAPRARTAEGAA
jgi:sulfoxide reductase heme-binding subunit YedZ